MTRWFFRRLLVGAVLLGVPLAFLAAVFTLLGTGLGGVFLAALAFFCLLAFLAGTLVLGNDDD